MLTAFDDGTMGEGAREAMLLATGAAVVIFIALMAIGMLTRGVRRLTETNNEKDSKSHPPQFSKMLYIFS